MGAVWAGEKFVIECITAGGGVAVVCSLKIWHVEKIAVRREEGFLRQTREGKRLEVVAEGLLLFWESSMDAGLAAR